MHTLGSEPALLRLCGVSAGYGDATILDEISLNIPEGKIVTVIGANGAGKSTLLRAVFGMIQVSRGQIEFGGRDITRASSVQRLQMGVAYCPQGRCNFPAMTVRENLEMGAYRHPRGGVAMYSAIEELFDLFPLLRIKERTPAGNMSGGEQQVLEMAMALVMSPRLLLCDEPSIGLAPRIVAEVLAQVESINRRGVTVLMVEQNARSALKISHLGVVMKLGQIILVDRAENIRSDEDLKRHYLAAMPAKRVPED